MNILEYCNKKTLFKIYSLFLMADGHITSDEQNLLDKLAEEMGIDKDVRSEIQSYINRLMIKDADNFLLIVQECEKNGTKLCGLPFFEKIAIKQIQTYTIWNLIHLGYCDTEYSEPEKKVVAYLANRWKVSLVLRSEFEDTAETLSLLCKHKQWIKNTGTSYDATDAKLKEVDAQIQKLYDNISVTISEVDTIREEK